MHLHMRVFAMAVDCKVLLTNKREEYIAEVSWREQTLDVTITDGVKAWSVSGRYQGWT